MRVELSCWLPRSPEWVWERVRKPETLEFVAAPLIKFVPIDGAFPEEWSAGNYRVSMRLFGVLPLGSQTVGIEYPCDAAPMTVRDNGSGLIARTWDHWIFIAAEDGDTRYKDRVDVSAGLLTPFIALFARFFYAHRQRRWRLLASSR